ncbi:MAG: C-GCAxxG-C-C family protein, partial [Oscillospiraceae bacterium]
LANPYTDPNDKEAKKKIALLAKECTKAFKDKFGSLTCRDLKKNNTPGSDCADYIRFAAEFAEKKIKETEDCK